MTDDAIADLANERLVHVRQKWERQRRPAEAMAHAMLWQGVYWLAELKGAMTVAAMLDTFAHEIRRKMVAGEIPTEPKPIGFWERLNPWRT